MPMISFEGFMIDGHSPIYAQLVRFIKSGVAAGTIQNGDEIPSRRELSALLGVNPNTIQKAFRILEEENVVFSRTGAKSYVTADETMAASFRTQLAEGDTRTLIGGLKQLGLKKGDALRLMEHLWDEEEGMG